MTGRRRHHIAVRLAICASVTFAGVATGAVVTRPHASAAPAASAGVVREPYPVATLRPTASQRPSARPSSTPPPSAPKRNPSRPTSPQQLTCGPVDVTCQAVKAINGWFAGLVSAALKLVLPLLSHSLLSTPDVTADARVQALWRTSVWIADTCYVLFVLAGGITLLTGYGAGSRYTVGQVAPRLVIGVVAGNVSLIVVGQAITFANALSSAFLGDGFRDASLFTILQHATSSGIVLPLMGLVAIILAFVVVATYVVRLMLCMLLTAAAPLFLACHGLPQTERFAAWWWRAIAGILLIQAGQALVLAAAVRVWFTGTSLFPDLRSPERDFTDVLLVICLLYVAARIPFWVWRLVTGHGVGASPIAGTVRFVLYTLVLSRVSRVLRGAGVRTARPGRPPPPPSPGRPGPQGGRPGGPGAWVQPELPLNWPNPGAVWPRNRPHGGQMELPFALPPDPGPPVTVRDAMGGQTELPFNRPRSPGGTQLRIPRGVAWEQTALPIQGGPRPIQDELPFPPSPRYVQGELPLGVDTTTPRPRRRPAPRPTLGDLNPDLRSASGARSGTPPVSHTTPPPRLRADRPRRGGRGGGRR